MDLLQLKESTELKAKKKLEKMQSFGSKYAIVSSCSYI